MKFNPDNLIFSRLYYNKKYIKINYNVKIKYKN